MRSVTLLMAILCTATATTALGAFPIAGPSSSSDHRGDVSAMLVLALRNTTWG